MKKIFTLLLIVPLTFAVMAQQQHFSAVKRNLSSLKPAISINDLPPGLLNPNVLVSSKSALDAGVVCETFYDMQTNSSDQNRIYMFPDGTVGATATMAHDQSSSFTDRGTGYNYYDGTAWGSEPSQRIESVRTGWPSYAPFGPSGEIVVCHSGGANLIISTRATKGTGSWTQTQLAPPSGAAAMLWPRMVTNGPDHTYIHIIALTEPTGNGGTKYNGLDGALLYNRSLDGGATWDGWKQLDGMKSDEYLGFSGDSYAWADPRGNTLAFTTGDNWYDQFVMKTTDNGETWSKIMVWNCLYNLWAGGADTIQPFYCPDGCMALALDTSSQVHLTFGVQRAQGYPDGSKYWFPYTQGLAYWNETMPALRQDLNPDSLYAAGNLPGFLVDPMVLDSTNTGLLAYYYNSMTSDPTMLIDNDNNLFVAWDGVTSQQDVDGYMLRHIYERTSLIRPGTVISWSDSINDLTKDLEFFMTECVFPSASPTSNDRLYIIFQNDDYAGAYVKGSSLGSSYPGQQSISNNYMKVLTPMKNEIQTGIAPRNNVSGLTVSKNYPNPFTGKTWVTVNMAKAGNVSIEVTNMMGQQIYQSNQGYKAAGSYQIAIDGSNLQTGMYFYTVKIDNQSITQKMMVK